VATRPRGWPSRPCLRHWPICTASRDRPRAHTCIDLEAPRWRCYRSLTLPPPTARFSLTASPGYPSWLRAQAVPSHWAHLAAAERAVLERFAGRLPVQTPTVHAHGSLETWPYLIMSRSDYFPTQDHRQDNHAASRNTGYCRQGSCAALMLSMSSTFALPRVLRRPVWSSPQISSSTSPPPPGAEDASSDTTLPRSRYGCPG
jgi:hypothetical protein